MGQVYYRKCWCRPLVAGVFSSRARESVLTIRKILGRLTSLVMAWTLPSDWKANTDFQGVWSSQIPDR